MVKLQKEFEPPNCKAICVPPVSIEIYISYTWGIFKIPFLQNEYKLSPLKTKYQYLTSTIFGFTFAVGWSPCIGAVLGSILTLAALNPASAILPMLAYSLGLGTPFLFLGFFGSKALAFIGKFKWVSLHFNKIAGVFLLILGILVATGKIYDFASIQIPFYFLDFLN